LKLYRSAEYPGQWMAYGNEIGWVLFPATENGWALRRPARGIDPLVWREVPLHHAANCGMSQPVPVKTQAPPARSKRAA